MKKLNYGEKELKTKKNARKEKISISPRLLTLSSPQLHNFLNALPGTTIKTPSPFPLKAPQSIYLASDCYVGYNSAFFIFQNKRIFAINITTTIIASKVHLRIIQKHMFTELNTYYFLLKTLVASCTVVEQLASCLHLFNHDAVCMSQSIDNCELFCYVGYLI